MTRSIDEPVTGVLLGDQGSRDVDGSGKVLLLIDENGDGDAADQGERRVFFDETNESGLENPSGSIFTVHQASDGAVYVGDGDTDTVYRLFDRNGDGDANDAGEATAWLSPANTAGVSTVTLNGIAEGPDGAIYVVNAGTRSAPQDAIYRTVDLNGDGDANDEGETTVWVDLQTVVPTSSAFDLSFIGQTAYLIDPSGGAENAIFAFRDANGDGAIASDEVTTFATEAGAGVPLDFTQAADGDSILVLEALDGDDGVVSLHRLTDTDGSGAIDAPRETVEVWNSGELPGIFDPFVGFSVASDGNGQVVLTSSGGDPSERNVYVLNDANGDGDYFDTRETNILASNALDETTLFRPRAVEFYEGPSNEPPSAEDDLFATLPGISITGNVLDDNGAGPDTDPDPGNELTVTAVNGEAVVGTAITVPSGAILTLSADGSFSYDPNGAFADLGLGETATDSFTYTVSDGVFLVADPIEPTHSATGTDANNRTGAGSSNTGDHNDDGLDDITVGAPFASAGGGSGVGESHAASGRDTYAPNSDEATVTVTVTGLRNDTTVGGGNHFSLFLDKETNTVFAAGESAFGQLGQGVAGFDVPAPLPVVLPEGFDEEIVSISAGLIHAGFLTASGDLWVWGFGNFGRLGLGDEETRLVPTKIEGELDDKSVAVIDFGNGASYAITTDGALYAWGQNASGQLGLGDEDARLVPTRVDALADERIIDVSSGTSHTLALTADGDVFAWGSNVDGQVGDPVAVDEDGDPVREVLSPVKVEGLPDDVVAVNADTQTSYAVTADGRVFGWGENSFGQLLIGTDKGEGTFEPGADGVLEPVELTGLPPGVVDVKGGARWAVALTDDGDVWAWGPNDEGPTGGLDGDPGAESGGTFFPVKIAELDEVDIVEIATGPNHIMAVAADGTVFTFGSNPDGRLGYPSEGSVFTPQEVDPDAPQPPYLIAASPGDNARNVAAATSFTLTYTDEVSVGEGFIRFVNLDDPTDVITIDVATQLLVEVDGATVTVTPPAFLDPDARYAVEIDDGAFEGDFGRDVPGIPAGDTTTFNVSVSDEPLPDDVEVFGTPDGELLRGVDGDDVVFGRGGDDLVFGNDGNDVLVGQKGSDTLAGGDGDDTLFGGSGDDSADGGAGNDSIRGGVGNDTGLGGAGADTLVGVQGHDSLEGGDGDDRLNGGAGRDTLAGGAGDDRLVGGADADLVRGGEGADRLRGDAGNDVIEGGGGSDRIRGGDGGDTLSGGDGDDRIVGGAGADVFDIGQADGRDVIVDFDPIEDVVRLADDGDFSIQFSSRTGDTILTYGETEVVFRDAFLSPSTIERQPLKVVALTGVDATDFAGISVADAGDTDGDGIPDLIIGAFSADRGDVASVGEAYTISGAALADLEAVSGVGTLSLGALDGGKGVTLLGDGVAGTFSNTGWSVSAAGDVDGDGLDDVLVGAFGANVLTGRTYLVYGSALEQAARPEGSATIDLANLDKADGVVLEGADIVDFSGYQVSDLGDLDGDGLDDILIGAGQAADFLGQYYVVFGSAVVAESGADGDGIIALGELSGPDGVIVQGDEPGGITGFQLSGAGDVDGDGVPDVIDGGWTASPNGVGGAGKATLVLGSTILDARDSGGFLDLATLGPEDGLSLDGVEAGDATGRSVAGAGDLDGDGFGEVLVGAYLSEVDGQDWTGEIYLVDGASLAAAATTDGAGAFDLSDLSGGRGVLIRGIEERDLTGFSVADAGDVNGGGAPDIVIGGYGINPNGGAYVLFGEALGDKLGPDGDGVFDLADLDPEEGVIIRGVAPDDVAGWQVARAGDVDGDGLEDIIMGAWEGDLAGSEDAGEAYIVTGSAIAEAARGVGIIELGDLLSAPDEPGVA